MSAEIKTVIGQLHIEGGDWRNEAPNQVAVREPKSSHTPGAGKGDLFIITEVRGPVSHQKTIEQRLAQTIRDAYYLSRGSITASLRRALQATNKQLYRHNQGVAPNKRIVAGAVVLVMYEDEAFIAQVGPTAFYAVLHNLVRRYPGQSLWLDDSLDPKEPALGINLVLEPNLHHLQVSAGDMLILADSGLAGQLALDTIVRAVVPGNAKTTIKNLGKAIQKRDCSALTLAIVAGEQSTFATLKRHAPAPLGHFLPGQRDAPPPPRRAPVEPAPQAVATAPAPVAAPTAAMSQADKPSAGPLLPNLFRRFARKFEDENQLPSGVPTEPRPAEPGVEQTPVEYLEDDYPAEPSLAGGQRLMDSVAHDPGFHPELQRGQATSSSFSPLRIFRWISAVLLLLVALLGNGLNNILRMVLPEGQQPARQAGAQIHRQQTSPGSWALLRNIVIVIPVIVALIVALSYLQKGQLREAEYSEFLTGGQQKFQQAQAVASDPAAAFGLLAEAESALVEAEKIKGPQPEIATLREQMRETADQIGQVQRLYYMPLLRQYTDSGTRLQQLVVQGVELYVLDGGTNRIFHHRLDDLGETLLPDDETLLLTAAGQHVDNVTIGNLLGMTWMPAGGQRQTSDLVILSNSGLLEYNPNWGITTSALASQEAFVAPAAVSSYFGNFYILDPQANRLLRYLPTADGYSAPPESYFPPDQQVNLAGAVDFAIDGAIYVLFGDGRISKFEGGLPATFNVTGLDRPFSNPVAIYTAPDEDVQYLYVADAGNQRIVQLEKDGRFVRQFKPSPGEAVTFANLQDIFVDEISGRLYILDSNNLYASNIPTVGE